MLNVLHLPNEILTKVVEELDIRSIFILRKVCHHLRNLIDDSKLSLRETNIEISVFCGIIGLSISCGQDIIKIGYQTHQNGCVLINKSFKSPSPPPLTSKPVPPKLTISPGRLPNFPNPPSLEISKSYKKKLLEGADFVEECLKDLNGILKILRWRINSFSFSLKSTLPSIGHLLSPVVSRLLEFFPQKGPLHMNFASISVLTPDELSRILPCIEPQKLHLLNAKPFTKTKIEAAEFVRLEYWKQMETFNSGSFVLTGVDFRDFSHFKNATVAVEVINCEDVEVLKEAFLRSTNFEQFEIKYENFADVLKMSEVLGNSVTSGEWLLRILETEQWLKISVNRPNHHSVNFSKC
ncbi:unnamed protein product [Caenorhabditis brenneri]